MKHLITLIISFLFFQHQAHAQDPMARLKYMDAEEAFSNGKYKSALTKLDEAEALLGNSNSKILFLRIMIQDQLIRTDSNFFKINENYNLLSALRDNCQSYIKNYDSPDLSDKIMEVYRVLDKYSTYPMSKQAFDLRVLKEKEKEAQVKNEQNRKILLAEKQKQLEEEQKRAEEEQNRKDEQAKQALIDKQEAAVFGFSSGTMAPFGLSIYRLAYQNIGFYSSVRFGFKKINDYGLYDDPTDVQFVDSKIRHNKGIVLDLGLTFPISYPVSAYTALGISDHETYRKSTYKIDGEPKKGNLNLLNDWTFGLNTAFGLICHLNKSVKITVGFAAMNFKHGELCFGLGFNMW